MTQERIGERNHPFEYAGFQANRTGPFRCLKCKDLFFSITQHKCLRDYYGMPSDVPWYWPPNSSANDTFFTAPNQTPNQSSGFSSVGSPMMASTPMPTRNQHVNQ